MTRLQIRVTANASRSEISGWEEVRGRRCLRIRIAAPPVEGKANEALIELLSKTLEVRKNAIEIVSGLHARVKSVTIAADEGSVLARLPP